MLTWKAQLRNEVETVRQTKRGGGRDNKERTSPKQMVLLWKLQEHVLYFGQMSPKCPSD